jgi:hypothetical protein
MTHSDLNRIAFCLELGDTGNDADGADGTAECGRHPRGRTGQVGRVDADHHKEGVLHDADHAY